MELNIHITPTLVLVCVVVLITLLIRLLSDIKDIRNNTKINRHLQQLGKKVAQKKVTVVIDLSKRASSIIPLLDHIYQELEGKREVVVLIRHTAGRNAKKDLEQYRRRNSIKNIRLVSMQSGMTVHNAVKRYASGTLVTFLTAEQRLSKYFFSTISLDFSIAKPDAVLVHQRSRINKTIFSAFEAYSTIWHDILKPGKNVAIDLNTLQPGILYKRSRIVNANSAAKPTVILSGGAHVLVESTSQKREFITRLIVSKARHFRTITGFATTLVIAGVLSYVWVTLSPQETYLLFIVTAGAYLLTYAGILSKLTGYSLLDKLNLLLLAPFFLIYDSALYLVGMLTAITGAFRSVPRIKRSTK